MNNLGMSPNGGHEFLISLEQAGLRPWADELADLLQVKANSNWAKQLGRMVQIGILSAEDTHNFGPSPIGDELETGGLTLGQIIFANYQPGTLAQLDAKTAARYPHLVVTGRTGTGKSHQTKILAAQVIDGAWGEVSLVVYDSEGEYRFLSSVARQGKLLALTPATFFMNPLQPDPPETVEECYNRFYKCLTEDFVLRGALSVVQEVITKESQKRGLFNGGTDWLTIPEVVDCLKALRVRPDRRGYLENALSSLQTLSTSIPGVRRKEGYRLDSMLGNGRHIVFDTSRLNPQARESFINLTISRLVDWQSRRASGGIDFLLVFDEGHRDLYEERRAHSGYGPPILFDLLAAARKRGIFALVITSSVADLPRIALTNFSTVLSGRISEGSNLRVLKDLCLLTPAQVEETALLKDYEMVLRHPLWPHSLKVLVPHVEFGEPPTEEEVSRRMEPLLRELGYRHEDAEEPNLGNRPAKQGDTGFKLVGKYKGYYEVLCERPDLRVGDIDEIMGIPKATGTRIRSFFEIRDLATFVKVNLPGRSGQALHGVVTQRGRELAKSLGIQPKELPGRGGPKHRLVTLGVKAMAEKEYPGCIVDIESEEAGVRADVMVTVVDSATEQEPQRVAYEICVNSLQMGVVRGLLAEGIGKVVIVVETAKALKSVRKEVLEGIGWEEVSRVEFLLEEEVMRHLPLAF